MGSYEFANELLCSPDEGFASVPQGALASLGEGSFRPAARQPGVGDGASGDVGTKSEKTARVARGYSCSCVERKSLLMRGGGYVFGWLIGCDEER